MVRNFLRSAGGMGAPVQEPLWLVWQYEGDFTLYDLMQKKDWPYNLEPLLLGRELDLPRSPRRRWATLRLVMQQVRRGSRVCGAPWKPAACACLTLRRAAAAVLPLSPSCLLGSSMCRG
jgi:hypothetical protein